MAVGVGYRLQVICYRLQVTDNIWHVPCDMWHVTSDTWQVTCDRWHKNYFFIWFFLLLLCYYLQASRDLAYPLYGIFLRKGWIASVECSFNCVAVVKIPGRLSGQEGEGNRCWRWGDLTHIILCFFCAKVHLDYRMSPRQIERANFNVNCQILNTFEEAGGFGRGVGTPHMFGENIYNQKVHIITI